MPSLPTITLGAGEILVLQGASVAGLTSTDRRIQFGQVVAVFSGADTVAVNDYITFDPKKVEQLMFGSTIYLKMTIENISGKEIPAH